MAVKTFRLGAGNDGNFGALFEADQTAASRADGWTVAKIAATNQSDFDAGTKQLSTSFAVSAKPASFLTGATANALKTPAALTGTFANAAWTLTFAVRATTASAQAGRVRMRVFKSVNADGSSATELTGSTQVGTTSSALSTTADVTSTVTWSPGATITLNNEYLFFVLAWEITTASGSNSGDVVPRTGQAAAGSRIVTPNIAATSFGVTASSFTFGSVIAGQRKTFASTVTPLSYAEVTSGVRTALAKTSGVRWLPAVGGAPVLDVFSGALTLWNIVDGVPQSISGQLGSSSGGGWVEWAGSFQDNCEVSIDIGVYSSFELILHSSAQGLGSYNNAYELYTESSGGNAGTSLWKFDASGAAYPVLGSHPEVPQAGDKLILRRVGGNLRLYRVRSGVTTLLIDVYDPYNVGPWSPGISFYDNTARFDNFRASSLTQSELFAFGEVTAGQASGFASDAFTDTDSTALASHVSGSGGWAVHPANSAGCEIRSNQVRAAANSTWLYSNSLPPPVNDYSVRAEVVLTTVAAIQQYAGVTARMSPTAVTFYSFRFLYGAAGAPGGWQLGKFVNGTFTSLQNETGVTLAPGTYQIELKVEGTTITAYINGAQKYQVTDASIASGRAGIIGFGQASVGQGLTLDNFSVSRLGQTVFGATSQAFTFGATTQAQRKTTSTTASSYAFSSATQGIRKTFGVTATPFVFGEVTQARRKTFSTTATPLTFGAATVAQRKTFNSTVSAFTFSKAVSGVRKTFSTTATPFAFLVVTQGNKKTFGQIVVPALFGAVTAGTKAAGQKFGSVAAAFSFGSVTQAQRKTFSTVAAPFAFGAATQATRRTTGVIFVSLAFGVVTQSRKQYVKLVASFTFGEVTQGKKKTYGVVARPITWIADTQGIGYTGSKTFFGATETTLTFTKAVVGQKKTFGTVALLASFSAAVSAQRKTFGSVLVSISFQETTSAIRLTHGATALPVLVVFSVAGTSFATRYGAVSVSLFIGMNTDGNAFTNFVIGRIRTTGRIATASGGTTVIRRYPGVIVPSDARETGQIVDGQSSGKLVGITTGRIS